LAATRSGRCCSRSDNVDFAWAIDVGYRLNRYFALQASYVDLGEASGPVTNENSSVVAHVTSDAEDTILGAGIASHHGPRSIEARGYVVQRSWRFGSDREARHHDGRHRFGVAVSMINAVLIGAAICNGPAPV
jgi:hypothetical protein